MPNPIHKRHSTPLSIQKLWSLWEGCPEECATQMRPQAGATKETEEPSMQDLSEAHSGQHIRQHEQTCMQKRCYLCLLTYVKNTAHDCQYKLCRVCGKKQLKNAPHECLARWEPCPTCHQPYLLAKPEKYQCQKQCYLCKKYFLLTEYDGHACLKTYCNICKRNHPADAVCIPR